VISSPLVAPVQGYLDQGPTVSGEIVAGEPGKSALDVVVELQDEVLALKEEQHRLRSQLDAARATIRQQEQTLEEATQELQQSAHDLSQMRNRLGDWQQQLAEISTHYLDAQTQQDSVVAELERRLRQILADCEADSRTRSVMQLAPDQPTAPPASPEDGPQL
jgi:ABC-type transporter Mla subunit MlaD